ARWLCHQRLAALPPEFRKRYRDRVDVQARKWLDEGRAARDGRLLRRVVEEAFCSRWGEPALELLGDLAFERGSFAEARRWRRLLAAPAVEAAARKPEALGGLRFPDPQTDLARVRARHFLARLFQGDHDGLAEELQAFRELHGKAAGTLAGRSGNYA